MGNVRQNTIIGGVVLAVFAISGVVALSRLSAADTEYAIESSGFSLSGLVGTQTDTAASGDSYIAFGSDSIEQQIQAVKDAGIVALGDSLMHQIENGGGAAQLLQQNLINDGWSNIHINAQGCRSTGAPPSFCPTITSLIDVLTTVRDSNYNGAFNSTNIGDINTGLRIAKTVVIGLGINDIPHDTNVMEQRVRQVVSLLDDINLELDIHWVRVCQLNAGAGSGAAMNAALERVKDELELELIDWNSQCMQSYFFDSAHYFLPGAQAYMNTIASGVIPTPDEF